MKRILLPLLASLFAASLVAQSSPTGWRERIDRSTNAEDPDPEGDVKLVTTENGFHIETPSAAVFWHPDNALTGNYTLKGTFKVNRLSSHVNYFGFIFGGSNLEGADQKYTYFMVNCQADPQRGPTTGAWLIKTRDGENTATAYPGQLGQLGNGAVEHDAVILPGPDETSVNTLEVRVQSERIDYVVNGTVVYSAPRSSVTTDGLWGIRSNHTLDIEAYDLSAVREM